MLLERDVFRAHGSTAVRHLTDDDRRQLARLGHDIGWRRLGRIAVIATTRTIRRWFRELISQPKRTKSPGGKNRTSKETEQEIVRLAIENGWSSDAWGAKRIVGEMQKLGVDIAKSTVSAILRRHGVPPAPQRGRVTNGDRVIVHDPATTAAIDFAKVAILDQGSVCLVHRSDNTRDVRSFNPIAMLYIGICAEHPDHFISLPGSVRHSNSP